MVATTAVKAVRAVSDHPVDAAVRVVTALPVGKALHQGDIYLHRVRADWPRGTLLGTHKLAIGEGEGSRHFAEGPGVQVYAGAKLPPGVKEPEWVQPGALLGPVVVVPEYMLVSHPVHPDHDVQVPGTYQVTYQADFSTQRRVQD